MKNYKINSNLESFEKSYNKLKSVMEEEIGRMETVLNKEKVRGLNRLLITDLSVNFYKSNNDLNIQILGFSTINECDSFKINSFKKVENYSKSKIYSVKGKELEELKLELSKVKESFTSFINDLYLKEKEFCEENSLIAKTNLEIYNGLIEHITSLGFEKSYLAYKTKRSRHKERMEHSFVSDLKRQVSSYWAFETAKSCQLKLLKDFDKLIDDILKIKIDERNKELEENKARYKKLTDSGVLKDLEKLEILIKDLNLEGFKRLKKENGILDIESLKIKLFKFDRLIEIGYLLELNRNKLNNGTFYAEKSKRLIETEIKYFSYNSESEKMIWLKNLLSELTNTINNYIDDGRVFRDMNYNYNVIYNKVEELYNISFNKLSKVINKLVEIELKLDII